MPLQTVFPTSDRPTCLPDDRRYWVHACAPMLLKNYFLKKGLMQIHFTDFVTAANLLVLLGIYRKLSIIVYQHKLMWTDFAERKGISANGKHSAADNPL